MSNAHAVDLYRAPQPIRTPENHDTDGSGDPSRQPKLVGRVQTESDNNHRVQRSSQRPHEVAPEVLTSKHIQQRRMTRAALKAMTLAWTDESEILPNAVPRPSATKTMTPTLLPSNHSRRRLSSTLSWCLLVTTEPLYRPDGQALARGQSSVDELESICARPRNNRLGYHHDEKYRRVVIVERRK